MKLWIATALIALMTVSTYPRAAKAGGETGNELLGWCEGDGLDAQGLCLGFIAGAGGGFQTGVINIKGQLPFCYPEGSTGAQSMRIVVKYLKEHPEDLHEDAAGLVALALIEAYPCD